MKRVSNLHESTKYKITKTGLSKFFITTNIKTLIRVLHNQNDMCKADNRPSSFMQFLDSIVVSIPACHAGDRGSIPRRGGEFFHNNYLKFFKEFTLSFIYFVKGY